MPIDPPVETTFIPYHACQGLAAKVVLVLAPHADDEVFGCAGAVIRHVQTGCAVSVVVLSDGAYNAGDQTSQVIATREAESCAAAALLGYPSPAFWRLPDRGIVYGETLIDKVMAAITAAGADLVYAPAVTEMHPDHRAVAMVAAEAIRRLGAGFRLAMYEVGVPLSPNVLLDISAQVELKQRAMQCFASQLKVQAYDTHIAALNRFRTYTLPASVSMAEAYYVLDGVELSQGIGGIADAAQAQIFDKWSHRLNGQLLRYMVAMHSDLQTAHAETVRQLKQTASQQAQHILEVENRLQKQDFQLAEANAALSGMQNSTSWRLTAPIRMVGRWLLQLRSLVKRLLT
ncbi:MAG: PIG-L family deacetylase [Burkholderiales bacterium]|nr:PIG-L family deacetylase [Burkholderiales bacterium]